MKVLSVNFVPGLERHGVGQAAHRLGAERGERRDVVALGLAAAGDDKVIAFAHAARLGIRAHAGGGLGEVEHGAAGVLGDAGDLVELQRGVQALDHEFLLLLGLVVQSLGSLDRRGDGAGETARPAVRA